LPQKVRAIVRPSITTGEVGFPFFWSVAIARAACARRAAAGTYGLQPYRSSKS